MKTDKKLIKKMARYFDNFTPKYGNKYFHLDRGDYLNWEFNENDLLYVMRELGVEYYTVPRDLRQIDYHRLTYPNAKIIGKKMVREYENATHRTLAFLIKVN